MESQFACAARTVPLLRAAGGDVVSLKGTVEAADIANMALSLASPFGASITGQAISVDGDVQMMQ